jgi:hypothetical protein
MSTDLQNRLLDASQWDRKSKLPVTWLLHTDVSMDAERAKSSTQGSPATPSAIPDARGWR